MDRKRYEAVTEYFCKIVCEHDDECVTCPIKDEFILDEDTGEKERLCDWFLEENVAQLNKMKKWEAKIISEIGLKKYMDSIKSLDIEDPESWDDISGKVYFDDYTPFTGIKI